MTAPDRLPARLASRTRLARLVLWWEAAWPALWPPLGILGVFLVVALAGLPLVLPGWLHLLLLAAFAVALPAFFIILALAACFGGSWNNRWVAAALAGLRPAVVALIAGAALRLGRNFARSPLLLLAAATGAALMLARILGPVPLILLGAGAGLAIHVLRRKKEVAP